MSTEEEKTAETLEQKWAKIATLTAQLQAKVDADRALTLLPANPPLVPIPASVVFYEGMRIVPSLLAEVIVGGLMWSHILPGEMGLIALMAILAGQLYPKSSRAESLLTR